MVLCLTAFLLFIFCIYASQMPQYLGKNMEYGRNMWYYIKDYGVMSTSVDGKAL